MSSGGLPSFVSPSGAIRSTQVGELTISVIHGNIADDEWRLLLEWSASLHTPPTGTLGFNHAANISVKQRKDAAELVRKQGALKRVGVMLDSILLRGLVTAFSWLVRETKYKTFEPTEISDALAWLAEEIRFDPNTAREVFSALMSDAGFGQARAV
jgi:hypothetical protein